MVADRLGDDRPRARPRILRRVRSPCGGPARARQEGTRSPPAGGALPRLSGRPRRARRPARDGPPCTSRRAGSARRPTLTSGCSRRRPTTSIGRSPCGRWHGRTTRGSSMSRRATAYLDLAARYPQLRLVPGEATVAEARRGDSCARQPYVRLLADRRQPPIAPPMVRRWYWNAPTDRAVRAMNAVGVVPSLEASRIVLGDGEYRSGCSTPRPARRGGRPSWDGRPAGPATSRTS